METVDKIVSQWKQQGFDSIELLAMESIGRIKRLENLLMKQIADMHKESHQLAMWEFDVLVTLRRSGEPYILSPTELFASTMVTSGAMTNRLHQLTKRGLINRVTNPEDRRSLLVKLTTEGFERINEAMIKHIEMENQLLKDLSCDELKQLNLLLKNIETNLG